MNSHTNDSNLAANLFDFNKSPFEEKALAIFRLQATQNSVYRRYLELIGVDMQSVGKMEDIPFLPIRFFKSHEVCTGEFTPEVNFESSGTTGSQTSRHLVRDLSIYQQSFLRGFQQFYGDPSEWCIIGLLPAYLERSHSSLVYMVDHLVKLSKHPESGFYLYDHAELHKNLQSLEARGQKTLLIGVTFALLDFADAFPMQLKHTVVMETGGMKGRREEWTRSRVHTFLSERLGTPNIHSEYGMTEMLSQAYSKGNGIFYPAEALRIVLREEDDPFALTWNSSSPSRGIINLIDLANIWSCSFIATDDAGVLYPDGSFEVIGRVDNSDIRGCSLMVV